MAESAALRILQGMKTGVSVASERISAAEFGGTIDTGSYLFNAALSGSLYGGIQDNKISGFAGLSGTYKSYFFIQLAAQFLKDYPGGNVIWYDTEAATTLDMFESRGCDGTRILLPEVFSVEELRNHVFLFLDQYLEMKREERQANRVMIVIDSVSMLASETELDKVKENEKTTPLPVKRAQAWASLFRVVSLRLARANVPMLCTSHAGVDIARSTAKYQAIKERGAGESLRFASSVMCMLGTSKLTEGDGKEREQVGDIVKVTIDKSRFTKKGMRIEVKNTYECGLDRYFGLVDLALEAGIFKKGVRHIELPDGSKHFQSAIEDDPKRFFTTDVMAQLEAYVKKEFSLGKTQDEETEAEIDPENPPLTEERLAKMKRRKDKETDNE